MSQELKIILHCRVSTSRQKEDGYGLDTQLRENRDYAKVLGATVVKEIVSNYANEGEDREDLEEIKTILRSGMANSVMFWSIDRSTRGGLGEWYLLTKELQDLGAAIYYGHTRTKAGTTAEEQAMDSIYAVFANLEKAKIRERTMGGWRSKALRGEYLGHGKVNYGYLREGEKGHVTIAPDPVSSAVVIEIFNRFTGWEGFIKQGVRAIARELTERRVPTPIDVTESKYKDRKKRGYGNWNIVTIYKILRNPIYKGVYTVYRQKSTGYVKSKSRKRYIRTVKRDRKEHISIAVPPLISELQWDIVQQILDTGKEQSARNSKHKYLLQKRLKCGNCGCTMRGKLLKRHNGDYTLYRCHGTDAAYTHSCSMFAIPTARLDEEITSWIIRRFLVPDYLPAATSSSTPVQTGDVERLKDKLAEIEKQETNLRRLVVRGILDDLEYQESKKELTGEKEQIQQALDRLQQRITNKQLQEHYRKEVGDLIDRYRKPLLSGRMNNNAWRVIIDALDIRVKVTEVNKPSFSISVKSLYEYEQELDTWVVE